MPLWADYQVCVRVCMCVSVRERDKLLYVFSPQIRSIINETHLILSGLWHSFLENTSGFNSLKSQSSSEGFASNQSLT